ncbi:MAG: endonuclease/exonuclease/phosphatase family protein [Clostridia bacterium]|nr:endonuclease/exonuclease/phosphatase family protein [Clostridia bacterium]
MAKIKVMTFNLRTRVTKDGNNCFDNRTKKIKEMLANEKPDIIGFQEVTTFMQDWLKETLTDYYVLGCGRDAVYQGEGIPIAFRKDSFNLYNFHQEWLSLYPQKPASCLNSLDQSRCPRIFSCAELVHKDSDVPFAIYNIHTDHRGQMARIVECATLMRAVAASPLKFVITGDFNACSGSPEITLIEETAEELGTVDACSGITGSFHGFTGQLGKKKIDYIFTNLPTDPTESYGVPDDDSCGCYYSDHNALCAFVEI